jgi:mitotic spindle assembly checkpoint protein MAD2
MCGNVQKLVIVIASVDTGETCERWEFKIDTDDEAAVVEGGVHRDEKDITSEIQAPASLSPAQVGALSRHGPLWQAIIRQITASVTFLPLLTSPCTFDLLVYTDSSVDIPVAWEESDPKYIANSAEVRLRSFTTKVPPSTPSCMRTYLIRAWAAAFQRPGCVWPQTAGAQSVQP